MIELRGKAVADAHKAILQEKVAAVGDSVITMAVLLVGEDHGAHMYATFMEKTAKNFGYGFVLKQLPETATQEYHSGLKSPCTPWQYKGQSHLYRQLQDQYYT